MHRVGVLAALCSDCTVHAISKCTMVSGGLVLLPSLENTDNNSLLLELLSFNLISLHYPIFMIML